MELVDSGVPTERLQVFNADAHPFSVTYKTIVSLTPEAGPEGNDKKPSGTDAPQEAAGVQNGVRLSSMFKAD